MYPFRILVINMGTRHLFRVVYQEKECYNWDNSGPEVYQEGLIHVRSVSMPEITVSDEFNNERTVYLRGVARHKDHITRDIDSEFNIADLEHINKVMNIRYQSNETN